MTTIQRLGIQGIRSYGPDQEQSIVFTPPLTLIVGSNGCGKTTVIESLRMATCGVLPPNSGSGQAFVHDPRVSAAPSTETKAKICLKFQAKNTTITVSRLFNLTNKKGPNRVEKQQVLCQASEKTPRPDCTREPCWQPRVCKVGSVQERSRKFCTRRY